MTAGAVAIILAAGSGERMGRGEAKAFIPISGKAMLSLAVAGAVASRDVASLVIAVPKGTEDRASALLGTDRPVTFIPGGRTRQESVALALEAIPVDSHVVVCHDAARPFASPALFSRVIESLDEAEGAVPILPIVDTVKRVGDGMLVTTEPRERLGLAQTPQAFRGDVLRDAHDRAVASGTTFTDDAALVEWAGYSVRAVPGEVENFKVTSPMDLARAELMLEASRPQSR
ncbi:MAG: 2-C-methyl-D-erythritol 4-phosphate cytidylyltransferase [Actinomycetota bacterium]